MGQMSEAAFATVSVAADADASASASAVASESVVAVVSVAALVAALAVVPPAQVPCESLHAAHLVRQSLAALGEYRSRHIDYFSVK